MPFSRLKCDKKLRNTSPISERFVSTALHVYKSLLQAKYVDYILYHIVKFEYFSWNNDLCSAVLTNLLGDVYLSFLPHLSLEEGI